MGTGGVQTLPYLQIGEWQKKFEKTWVMGRFSSGVGLGLDH